MDNITYQEKTNKYRNNEYLNVKILMNSCGVISIYGIIVVYLIIVIRYNIINFNI